MAYRIISPEFSFVRFSDQHLDDLNWMDEQLPGAELGIILPVNTASDLAFQFIIEADTSAEIDDICNSTGGPGGTAMLTAYPGGGLGETITEAEWDSIVSTYTPAEVIADLGGGRIRLSDTQVFFYIPAINIPAGIECGDCFQLIFAPNNLFDYGFYVSNIFNYQCDNTDYTSVIEYYSELDEADFLYCVSPVVKNRVRLPIYLTRPTFGEDEEVYKVSSGRYRRPKVDVRKVYEVITDNFPAWIIENLRAVFIHDYVFIEDDPALPQTMPYRGEIAKEGAFEPQYTDYQNYPLARVAFKVVAVDFQLKKNNCGECADYSGMITTDDHTMDIDPGTPYTVDLFALTDSPCCDPVTWTLETWNPDYLAATPVVNYGGGIFANITFTTKASYTVTIAEILATVRVSCGSSVQFIQIIGTF